MKICVAGELGNAETLSEREQSCLDSEAKINYVEVEQAQSDNHVCNLSFGIHVDESQN